MKMQAYAILDGGGVKGAALAGCLQAADDWDIEFLGYGGTSAGSIVALLAAVGYSAAEMKHIMVKEIAFTELLDDNGEDLLALKSLPGDFSDSTFKVDVIWKYRVLVKRLLNDFGLYDGKKLQAFIQEKVHAKKRELTSGFTFADMTRAGCKPLKIVVSNLGRRKPAIFSDGGEFSGCVLDAVRASMSYPFVFKPVVSNQHHHVDGGLSSNLPLFLFETERQREDVPIFAFDLKPAPEEAASEYKFHNFCGDMMNTALESGDYLMREVLENINYVEVEMPQGINTLDFDLTQQQRDHLFLIGKDATTRFLTHKLLALKEASDEAEHLQAQYVPPALITPALRAFALDIERVTRARDVRASVMLPTGKGTRTVVYHYNMDADPDRDLELGLDAGCSGQAFKTGQPVWADLTRAREMTDSDRVTKWQISREVQAKVKQDRGAMLSIPIFNVEAGDFRTGDPTELPRIGVLSADTASSFQESGWHGVHTNEVVFIGQQWADIIGAVLK